MQKWIRTVDCSLPSLTSGGSQTTRRVIKSGTMTIWLDVDPTEDDERATEENKAAHR